MKNYSIKIEAPSRYWQHYEAERAVYYHFRWHGQETFDKFYDNEIDFIEKYIALSKKYGIAEPIMGFHDNLITDYRNYVLQQKQQTNPRHDLLYYFYAHNTIKLYPSRLFLNTKGEKPKLVSGIDPLLELDEAKKSTDLVNEPFKVELLSNDYDLRILCYLDNDAFLPEIDNKKTRSDESIGGKGCWIDSSALAYLNAPRLNSFLRALRNLSQEFGASEFKFENSFNERYFSEDGVLFDGEAVFFEDISDMLEGYQKMM